jgi:hypothetical protein
VKRSARDEPTSAERLGALYRSRTGRVLRTTLVASTALLATALVLRQARAAVDRLPGCRLGTARPAFLDLPAWVDEGMRARLEAPGILDALRRLPGGRPAPPVLVFDAGAEHLVAEAFARHPMVQSVSEVEIRFPREVRLRATLRAPVARFRADVSVANGRSETRDVPVASDGVALPEAPYARFLADRLSVTVLGVRARYPGPGRRWEDTDEQVREAIEAARVANRLNDELLLRDLRVAFVDVERFPAPPRRRRQGEVVFLLSDGRRLQWGRTERDAQAVPREDSYAVKRERLLDLVEEPRSAHPKELDVRFDRRGR